MSQNQIATQDQPFLKWVLFFACVSILIFWRIPHIGEEGVYTLSVFEMWHNNHWWSATVLGQSHARPPFYQWIISLGVYWTGLEYTLVVARSVSALATLATAWMIARFANHYDTKSFVGLWTAVIFLSGDVLLRRGWLAYADPLFSCLICASILLGWEACEKRSYRLLTSVVVSLSLAYLSKTYTCYVFYLTASFIWLTLGHRKFLFNWRSIVIHIVAIAFPVIWGWMAGLSKQTDTNWDNLIYNLWFHLQGFEGFQYIHKLLKFPLELFILLLPASFVGLVLKIRLKQRMRLPARYYPLCWFVFLAALPYWLVPHDVASRYMLPLMPFLSLILAAYITQTQKTTQRFIGICLGLVVLMRMIGGIWLFPYDQTHRRGNAAEVAKMIMQQVKQAPLYANDSSSRGLRVAWEINRQRNFENPVISLQDEGFSMKTPFYLLNSKKDPQYPCVASYHLDRGELYLQCIGEQCAIHHH